MHRTIPYDDFECTDDAVWRPRMYGRCRIMDGRCTTCGGDGVHSAPRVAGNAMYHVWRYGLRYITYRGMKYDVCVKGDVLFML